jgi:hypothetical protein
MKTEGKNGQRLYRQPNKRWKWMAGATAATAAGVTASQADLVTIDLTNNYISAIGGNHLNADLTGDGHPDITIVNPYAVHSTHTIGTSTHFTNALARVTLNGVFAYAFHFGDGYPIGEILGSKVYDVRYNGDPSTLMGSIPISFKDLHINGGARTSGLLEVTVSTRHDAEVQLDSFSYNNIPATPDQGSSLTLLAMGAGGVLALRRRRAGQRPS